MNRWRCQMKSARATTPSTTRTAIRSALNTSAERGRMAVMFNAARFCRAPVRGRRIAQATRPRPTIFSTDLPKCTRPSMPNKRLNPFIGLRRDGSGASLPVVQTNPCCSTLPAIPARMVAPSTHAMGSAACAAA